MIGVALELRAAKPEHNLVIVIEDETVLGAVDAKLVERGTHLGREGEIGGGPFRIRDDHSKLIHNIFFTSSLEKRAGKPVSNYPNTIAV